VSTRRRGILLVTSAVVLLGIGAATALVLTDELGISSEPADVPAEHPVAAPARAIVPPPALASVDAPDGIRIATAVDELRSAIADAGETVGSATLAVFVERGSVDSDAEDAYRLEGAPDALRVVAGTEAGAARGVYDLASAVRAGRPVTEHLGETVASALPFRMTDLGAVGVDPDPAEWLPGDDYSHNSGAFADAILPDAPYVDTDALAADQEEFEAFVRHIAAEGFTALAFPGLIEYLTFDGQGVYADGDDHVARALAMREAFAPMFRYADELGIDVYLRTDMLTLSTPLEAYLRDRFGGLDTADPALWEVYATAIDQLYAALPELDGLVIRIGEAGRIYDQPGWDYYSTLDVTTVGAVRAMLTALTAEGERADRDVVFRTWSVGVGAVGDMHTNADSYRAVLDGIDSDRLVVSTKYTLGDFYSHLPLNDTLEIGDQRRIVEFQSRREFEAFGAFPNDLGDLYTQAIRRFVAANPNVEGVWVWTQDGGPWRAGPMSLELESGFWQLYELDTQLAVALARDPDADPGELTADWAVRWFSRDPATIRAIGEAMTLSHAAIADGLYIGPFADRSVRAIGLEPPPMMWLFEWDILTGDSAVLDVVYAISRDELDEALAGGERALDAVDRMRDLVAGADPATWSDPAMRQQLLDSLDYERSTLAVLDAYRAYMLRNAEWHDTGSAEAHAAWTAALDRYRDAAAAHVERYAGDVQHPPLNLEAAQLGIDRAVRDEPMAWAARGLLVLVLAWLLLGALGGIPRVGAIPGARAARAMWLAGTRPWRAVDAVAGFGRADRVLLVAVPAVALAASRGVLTWFLAPAHALVMLAAWLVFALVVLSVGGRRGGWAVLAALGGAALLRVALLVAVLAPTGPGGYWFGFWTDPVRRSLYVPVALALLLWALVAAGWALAVARGARRATGAVLLGAGGVLALGGAFVGAVGLETALTVWNDQMGLLPWGLSRILGITVYLDIPPDAPWPVAALGAVLAVVGLALALPWRRVGRVSGAAPRSSRVPRAGSAGSG